MGFPMTNGLIISLITLVSFSNAYQDFSLKNLCPHSELKQGFNQLYSNRPGIQLNKDNESAALIHHIWTEDNFKEIHDCAFTIDSNLYVENERIARGMFFSVKKLNFRQKPGGECIDYLRISFDGAKTEKMCGSFDTDSEMGQTAFFNDAGGVIKIHIVVNHTIPLEANQRSLEVDLVATAYQQCTPGKKFIKCNPKEKDDFCIAYDFLRDNIMNCPPPYNTDEPDRKKFQQQQQQSGNGQGQAGTYVPWNYSAILAFTAISYVFQN